MKTHNEFMEELKEAVRPRTLQEETEGLFDDDALTTLNEKESGK